MRKVMVWICLLLLFSLITNPAFACSPGTGNQVWYQPQISFDESSFPAGVTHRFEDSSWLIKNVSSTPLYLVTSQSYGKKGITPDVPEKYSVLKKYQDGNTYDWNSNLAGETMDWHQEKVSKLPLLYFEYMNIGLKYGRDLKPDNPRLPISEPFSIIMYYGSSQVYIKGTINYVFNENYNLEQHRSYIEAADACASLAGEQFFGTNDIKRQILIVTGILALTTASIGAILYFKMKL